MGEEITYPVNDTNRAIGSIIKDLRAWESPLCNERIRALILTRLEEAQLWSLLLVSQAEEIDPIV